MTQTDQVMSRIATLSDAEITTLNATALPIPEIVEADNKVGAETSLVMAQVPENVDAGVYAVARVAVLGILSENADLVRVWTDVVGPFEVEIDNALVEGPEEIVPGTATKEELAAVAEPVIDTPHTPTEEEAADLGAPVEEAAKEKVAPELVDAPLDIQEGDINV